MRKTLFAGLALSVGAMVAVPHIAMAAPTTFGISGIFTNNCNNGMAWIELKDSSGVVGTQTRGSGETYSFTGLAEGDYSVVPHAPAGCGVMPYPGGAAVTLDGEDVTVDVGLVPVHSIWGVVTGCTAGGGEGVNGVVVAVDIDTDDLRYHAETVSAAFTRDGQFFFQYLPAFDGYQVTVTPPEGCEIGDPTVDVDLSTADADDIAFALETVPSPGSLASLDLFGSLGFLGSAGRGSS